MDGWVQTTNGFDDDVPIVTFHLLGIVRRVGEHAVLDERARLRVHLNPDAILGALVTADAADLAVEHGVKHGGPLAKADVVALLQRVQLPP